jgi:hypothetical protein
MDDEQTFFLVTVYGDVEVEQAVTRALCDLDLTASVRRTTLERLHEEIEVAKAGPELDEL